MKLNNIAAQKLIDELTKSKVVVEFTGESYSGYPIWQWDSDEYTIEEFKPVEGNPTKLFFPFSIKINDEFISPLKLPFAKDPRYKHYIRNLANNVQSEIDFNINLRVGKYDILSYLTNLEFDLKEILSKYELSVTYLYTDNEEGYIAKENHIPAYPTRIFTNKNLETQTIGLSREDEIYGLGIHYGYLYVEWALTRYWDEHLPIIERILKIIEVRKSIIEKTDDYVQVINAIPNQSNLQWKKSDTDLLELIVALNESGSIFCNNSSMTRKQTIEFFENLFGITIKDPESKLSRATERKKDQAPYLTFLKQTFENYSKKKLE